ncbi:MAG: metalloregulator ArsR/SmtB family transcription factor [Leptospira sp.]|nr:metalloregulator ArsR/SmtB family transcription factor [Leptospira sp.]
MVVKVRSNNEKKKESAIEALDKVLDSKFLTALAEPSRIEVLKQVIRCGKADISELSEGLSIDRSVISRHLGILEEVGILIREKQGKHVFYQLDPMGAVNKFRFMLNGIEELITICCPPNSSSGGSTPKKGF